MSCCTQSICVSKGAGLKITYTPSQGFTFENQAPTMRIWSGEGNAGSPLLTITESQTANGSEFRIVGGTIQLTIEKEDVQALTTGALLYDIVLEDATGFTAPFVGGEFLVNPDGSAGCCDNDGTLTVSLDGQSIPVIISGGSLGLSAAQNQELLNQALADSAEALDIAEQAQNTANSRLAINGTNIGTSGPTLLGNIGAAPNTTGGEFALSFASSEPRTVKARWEDHAANMLDFYDAGDGANYTPALNRACAAKFAVYVPAGTYPLLDKVTMAAAGNFIFGDGVTESVFTVTSVTFNMSATGVIECPTSASENHAGMTNVGFVLTQPNTSTRASFHQYPYVFKAPGVNRLLIGNIRITGGYNGLDLRGVDTSFNCGGLMGGRWEIGCINEAMTCGDAAGGTPSLDFWHIDTIHIWPFGFQDEPRYTAYRDGNTIAARIGRVDGFFVKDFSTFTGRIITSGNTAPEFEGPFGIVGGLLQDGRRSRLEFGGGRWAVGSFYGTTDLAGDYKIAVTGGHLNIGPWWGATSATTGTTPLFSCNGGFLGMGTGTVANCNPNAPVFELDGGGDLHVHNSTFLGLNNTTRSIAVIRQVGGTLTASGNVFQGIGTGSGDAISVAVDNFNVVTGNSFGGWGYTTPAAGAGLQAGLYGPNAGVGGQIEYRSVTASGTLSPLGTDRVIVLTGSSTSITNFGPGYIGQEITIICNGVYEFAGNSTSFKLVGPSSYLTASGDTLKMVVGTDGVWRQVASTEQKVARFTGTLDGSGLATFAHGITGLNTNFPEVAAFYVGASSELIPCTVLYIDGTNIQINGGASRSYKVTVRYR